MALEDRRSKWDVIGEGDTKIVYLVKLRIRAGKNRGVGSRGQRNLRIRAGKNHGLAGQGVQIWGQFLAGSQEPHTVGANGVESYQNDVGTNGGTGRGRGGRAQG